MPGTQALTDSWVHETQINCNDLADMHPHVAEKSLWCWNWQGSEGQGCAHRLSRSPPAAGGTEARSSWRALAPARLRLLLGSDSDPRCCLNRDFDCGCACWGAGGVAWGRPEAYSSSSPRARRFTAMVLVQAWPTNQAVHAVARSA